MNKTLIELNDKQIAAVAGGLTKQDVTSPVFDFVDGFFRGFIDPMLPITIGIGCILVMQHAKNHPELLAKKSA